MYDRLDAGACVVSVQCLVTFEVEETNDKNKRAVLRSHDKTRRKRREKREENKVAFSYFLFLISSLLYSTSVLYPLSIMRGHQHHHGPISNAIGKEFYHGGELIFEIKIFRNCRV